MLKQRIRELINSPSLPSNLVTICGWVRTKRQSKNLGFISLHDGSCFASIQCVVAASSPSFSQMSHVVTGTSLEVQGKLVDSPGKGQSKEIMVSSFRILGAVTSDYPLQKKNHSLEFLREIAHLRARTQTISSVFRVRHILSHATHEFFHRRGFYWVHTPIITASDSEGAGEMFSVLALDQKENAGESFFSEPAYLSVTGQLQAEYLALGLGAVYTFGPTFRAENSNTKRHLAEFWMIEPEVAFANLNDCIQLATDHFLYILRACLTECREEMNFFEKKHANFSCEALEKIAAKSSFERISYTDALNVISQAKRKKLRKLPWGEDLSREHEKFLCEEYFKQPVFVTDYPKNCKAFYMRANRDQKTVACMDFLVPKCGEIIGGSQREEREDVLEQRMKELGIKNLDWYLDLRKQGSVVHSGYGLGFDRMVLMCTGVDNIRDTIPSPRTPGNIKF